MSLRRSAAIAAAKLLGFVSRLAGKQGVTYAGSLAMKMDPKIMDDLASQVREKIFIVCGTNGKTTTNNLLCSALEADGKKVVCNHTGSNMLYGAAAAFVLSASLSGKLDADYACIEIDEASAVHVLEHFEPDCMILTNLFRDQLDRYGEIDTTIDLLERAVRMVPKMKLAVNGDDSLSAYLAMESGSDYAAYGISERVFSEEKTQEIREGRFCRRCGSRLDYDFYHYSQLGVYHCPGCGFSRPKIDFDASDIRMEDGLAFIVDGRRIHAPYRGFYNIYNILAVYAALRTAGCETARLEEVLEHYQPQFGRNEVFQIGKSRVLLNLAKNPAGFNQNIASVMEDRSEKDLIIVINDHAQDGTDISWLWDVDFDRMADASVRSVTVSGLRGMDMRLRLKYTDIPCTLEKEVKDAVEKRLADGCGNLYVLVNYTALYPTHRLLAALEQKSRGVRA